MTDSDLCLYDYGEILCLYDYGEICAYTIMVKF